MPERAGSRQRTKPLRRRKGKVPLNGIGPKRHPAPKWRNSAKRESGTIGESHPNGNFPPLGRVFTPKWQHSALRKSEKRRKILPFLLCQTEIKPVLAKSPIKDPSALSSDAKFRQNGVTHGLDYQNRSECPHFRCLAHHAQNGISSIGGIFHKTAPKTIGEFSAIGQIPTPHGGQRGSHSPPKKRNVSQKTPRGVSLPTGSKNKPSTPQIVLIPKPQGGKGDFIHH